MKQVERCYSVNRRSDRPFQFYVTDIGPKVRGLLDAQFKNSAGWDVCG